MDKSSYWKNRIQKPWAYLGIVLMLVLTMGPFFNYLKFPERAQANASTTWTKYGSNPVINNASAMYPRVIKDGGTYKMWVEASAGDIKYATSNDGISWSSFSDATGDANVHEPTIIKDGDTYKMWFERTDVVGTFGYKTSSDGTSWSATTATSGWTSHAWEDNGRYEPFVYKDGSTFVMHYQSFSNTAGEGGDRRINYATSADGITWDNTADIGQVTFNGSANNNILLTVGSSGAWDDNTLYSHSVLKNSSNTYELWYAAESGDYVYKIGYATSSNGTTWTKSGSNPILSGTTGQWDDGILYPNVIQDGTTYKMWFADDGWTGRIGYATAPAASSDTTAPTISNVSSDTANGYYNAGNVIDIDVTFSEAVTSTGNVTVTLETGDTDQTCTFTVSNSTTGSCNYTVQAGDTSSDLDVKSISGTIADQAGNPMVNFTPVTTLAANKAIVIDTAVPNSLPTMNDYYNVSSWNNTITGSASNGTSGVASVAITIQRNTPDTKYWDGDSWETSATWLSAVYLLGTWTYSFSSVADGTTYTIQSRSTDNAGNVQSSLGSDSFKYDTTVPNSTPVMNDFYNSGNWPGAVSGTATDATSGVASVQIKIQRSSDSYYWTGSVWQSSDPGWQAVSSGTTNWSYTLTSSNLTNSVAYTISSRATDNAGNIESTGSDTFMYHNMNWQQYRINPLPGSANAAYPSIIKDGSTYKMWYTGGWQIYYAYSDNGLAWQAGNPDGGGTNQAIFTGTAGQWDSYGVIEPWVIKDGSTYKMWYAGTNTGVSAMKIGYATSSDGITWTKSGSNPIIQPGPGGFWNNQSTRKPVVLKDGSSYKMWYNGTQGNNTAYNVGYAFSSDGVSWSEPESNPVLQHGSETTDWDFSNIWAMSVLKRGSVYEMYYSGNGANGQPDNGHKIGYAYSTNGTTWTKYTSNPVMTHGAGGSWNSSDVYGPFVMLDGTTYKMWYTGSNGTTAYLGYATIDAAADTTAPVSTPAIIYNYYGPLLWNHSYSIIGSATDAWGIEKVELKIQRTNGDYWTGSTWSATETWVNATDWSGNGYLLWRYTLDDTNFGDAVSYTVTSRATDGSGTVSGNVETSLSSDSFTYDSTNPTATTTQFNGTTPSSYYNSSSLPTSVAGTASDATSGVNSVYLAITRSTDNYYWRVATGQWVSDERWDDATGTTSWSYSPVDTNLLNSIRSLGDGVTYTVYAAAIDNVGNNYNYSLKSSLAFTYDNTGPTAGSVNDGTGADADYTASTTQLSANWSGFTDAVSGIASYQYSIGTTSGGTNVANWTSNGTNTSVTKTGLTLTNGQSYYVNVRAIDNAGNTGSVASSDGITVDVSLPTSAPTMNDYYNASSWLGQISGTASAGAGVSQADIKIQRGSDSKYWDGDSWETGSTWLTATGTNSWSYALAVGSLTDGVTYTITSRATDSLSRLQDPVGADSFAYDVTSPTAPASVTDGGAYTNSSSQLSASWAAATDATSGIQKYQYSIGTTQGGTNVTNWTDNGTNLSVTKTGLSLSDGSTYYFNVRAVDNANNTGSYASSNGIIVDITNPSAPGTPTDGGAYSNSTSQTFNWTAAADTGGSGVSGYYLSIGTTAGGAEVVNNLDVGNVLTYQRTGLSDGDTYYVKTRAYDNAGNIGSYSGNSNGITIDTTAPVTDPQLARTYYSSSNWPGSITVNLTDATSGIWYAGIAINRNSDGAGWCSGAWAAGWTCYTDTSDPGNTLTYVFSADNMTTGESYTTDTYARDNANNIELPHTQETFTYDNTAPSAPVINDGTGSDIDSVESLTTLSANWTVAADSQSGIDHYEYAIGTTAGGADVVSWTTNGSNTSVTKTGLSLSVGQAYYFSVRAVNGADITGTAGNSDGQTVTDSTPPSVSITTSPSSPTNDSTPQFVGSATDTMTNISSIQYKVDSGSWTSVSAADGSYNSLSESFNFETSALSEGSHTVYIRATDSSTNTTAEANYATSTFTVDLTAPASPSIVSPTSGSIISDNTPTIAGTAEANSTVLLTVSSETKSYSTTADSSGVWSYTMPDVDALPAGSHTIEAKARDSAGNTSSAATISFTVQALTKTSSSTAASVTSATASEPVRTIKIEVTVDKVTVALTQEKSITALPNSDLGLSIKPSLDKEIKSVIGSFEGATYAFGDPDQDGIYSASLTAPSSKGIYMVKATVSYSDGSVEEVNVNVLVDPYGYVYSKDRKGQEIRLKDAKTTLYVSENESWKVWDSAKYSQTNPQLTNQQGEYGFMVPKGKYYLAVEKKGYKNYKSAEISIEEGKPINLNIELKSTTNYWLWIIIGSIMVLIAGSGAVYIYKKRRKSHSAK